MRPTETQRRFRKQMAELEKKERGKSGSPYDYYLHRGKNRGFKKTGGSIVGAVVVLAIIVAVAWMYNNRDGADPTTPIPVANPGLIPQTHGQRLVPAKDATLLQSLDMYNQQMGEVMDAISAYHAVPPNQRDLNGYQQALLNGMSVSTEIESQIDALQVSSELTVLARIATEYTLHNREACSSYLDCLATGRNSDIKKGNHFLQTANQRSADYVAELRRYLQDNGYKYEIDADGGVRYWYSR